MSRRPRTGAAPSEPDRAGGTREQARVFFALWPDAATREHLALAARHLQAACGGRMPRPENIHLTLAFLGDVRRERLDYVRGAAERAQGPPHGLPIERFGWFRRNHVAWAGPLRTPGVLLRLVGSLAEALKQDGFAFDERPYEAHVTLLRKASCREVPVLQAPFEWPVREFVLVESELDQAGSIYTVIGRWTLR